MTNSGSIPFGLFWVAALLSNTVAAAQVVVLAWCLSDLSLPITVLVALQGADLLGTLAGVAVGAWAVSRFGHRRTLVVGSLLEGVACVVVAIVAFAPGNELSVGQAYLVAVLAGVAPFAAALGGPAWIVLVSRWPGTNSDTRQLLLDGVQFQVGGFLGPLVGGAAIAAVLHALQWISAANAITFFVIAALVLALRGFPEPLVARDSRGPTWTIGSLARSPAIWAMAVSSLATESSRIYLPRILRQAGEGPATLSIVLALISAGAVLAGLVTSRLTLRNRTLAAFALLGLSLGLGIWAVTPYLLPLGWFVGAVVVGAAVGIVHAPLMTMLMEQAGEDRRASGAAAGMAVRTIAGALGGVLFAALVAPLGSLVFLATSAMTLVTGVGIVAKKQT
ncbi:MFS transporter [Microbacterium lacticum]|uniref:MFS transporter n=1 Tax=Microbacterium lacticum TaxID=33885 RepID=UPI001F55ABFE|nr:MFS transporter [Microbacterium lacticum]